jgi:hypothetical protein
MKNYLKNFTLKDWIYIVLITILVVATIVNVVDRRIVHNEAELSKRMIDARSQVQIIHFTALSEGRVLTQKEKETIIRIWKQAEYSNIAPPPPPTDK